MKPRHLPDYQFAFHSTLKKSILHCCLESGHHLLLCEKNINIFIGFRC